jgi:hypothetical protein
MIDKAGHANRSRIFIQALVLAGILAGSVAGSSLGAQPDATGGAKPTEAGVAMRTRSARTPRREAAYYSLFWGVDSFNVKAVESGELIRFTYRIVDKDRAKTLNDKKIDAYLVDPASHVRLMVPSLEKVGLLRQSSTPIEGNSYWMAFSNPGRPVKRGDRVNIEIGQFRVEGLVVQ